MLHLRGSEIFADDPEGFRRKIIDEGEGPVRSYSYAPALNDECPYHCHARSLEIFLVVKGEGVAIVDGVEVALSAPDVLIVEPGEAHLVRSGPEPFHLLAVVAPNQDDGEPRELVV